MGFLADHLAPRHEAFTFSGAQVNRLTLDWVFSILSADDEIRAELQTLQTRARELRRNNAWAANWVRLVAVNLLGAKGVRLQSRLTMADGTPLQTANRRHETAWQAWSDEAGVNGDAWEEIEAQVLEAWATDGEALLLLHPGFDNASGFAVQVVDMDQLDHTCDRSRDEGENEISMGVEIDRWGRPVAYHLFDDHPSKRSHRERTRKPIAADRVIHLFRRWRPGQNRGIPPLTPVMLDLHWARGYQEAEVLAARVAAAKGGFFETDADGLGGGVDAEPDAQAPLMMDAQNLVFERLAPGEKFSAWDPTHPTTAFPDFMKSILRAQASGLGVSYSSLAGDLSDTSFSSMREGKIAERDTWKVLQQWVVRRLHRRVHAEWVRFAHLTGVLDTRFPTATYRARQNVHWQPRGWDWVDPEKDIQAAVLAIANGLDSRKRIVAERGRDFEENLDDLADEATLAAAKGLTLDTPAKPESMNGNGQGNGNGTAHRFRELVG